jgi:hypothetical protein
MPHLTRQAPPSGQGALVGASQQGHLLVWSPAITFAQSLISAMASSATDDA